MARSEAKKQHRREQRRQRLDGGLCLWCDRQRGANPQYCDEHHELMRQYRRKYWHEKAKHVTQQLECRKTPETHQRLPVGAQRVPRPDGPRGHGPTVLDYGEHGEEDTARCMNCGYRAYSSLGPRMTIVRVA